VHFSLGDKKAKRVMGASWLEDEIPKEIGAIEPSDRIK